MPGKAWVDAVIETLNEEDKLEPVPMVADCCPALLPRKASPYRAHLGIKRDDSLGSAADRKTSVERFFERAWQHRTWERPRRGSFVDIALVGFALFARNWGLATIALAFFFVEYVAMFLNGRSVLLKKVKERALRAKLTRSGWATWM